MFHDRANKQQQVAILGGGGGWYYLLMNSGCDKTIMVNEIMVELVDIIVLNMLLNNGYNWIIAG